MIPGRHLKPFNSLHTTWKVRCHCVSIPTANFTTSWIFVTTFPAFKAAKKMQQDIRRRRRQDGTVSRHFIDHWLLLRRLRHWANLGLDVFPRLGNTQRYAETGSQFHFDVLDRGCGACGPDNTWLLRPIQDALGGVSDRSGRWRLQAADGSCMPLALCLQMLRTADHGERRNV